MEDVDLVSQLAHELADLKELVKSQQREIQALQTEGAPPRKLAFEASLSPQSDMEIAPTPIHVYRRERIIGFLKKYWWDMFKVFIFFCACIGLIAYLISAIYDYQQKLASPSTSITLENRDVQPFPMVTICNWNIGQNCDACHIDLVQCYVYLNITTSFSCDDNPGIMKYIEVNLDPPYNSSYFYCYQFNFNSSIALSSRKTGFTGSVSMMFSVPEVPADNVYRKGVQVSFTMPDGKVPYEDETRYANAGSDTFFTITKVENTLLNQPTEHTWNAVAGTLDLPYNDTQSQNYVGVSFGYNTLSVTKYDQVISAQPSDLAGNLAGMTGTLTGLDAQKFVLMVLSIPYSIAIKSLEPFLDLMG